MLTYKIFGYYTVITFYKKHNNYIFIKFGVSTINKMSQRKLYEKRNGKNYGSSNEDEDESNRLLETSTSTAKLPQFLNKQAAAYETDVEIEYAASDGEYHSTESIQDFGGTYVLSIFCLAYLSKQRYYFSRRSTSEYHDRQTA